MWKLGLNPAVSATLLGFVISVNTVTLTAHIVLREGPVGIAKSFVAFGRQCQNMYRIMNSQRQNINVLMLQEL